MPARARRLARVSDRAVDVADLRCRERPIGCGKRFVGLVAPVRDETERPVTDQRLGIARGAKPGERDRVVQPSGLRQGEAQERLGIRRRLPLG
jgi:hypothetical protein